jgi:hypothetical protein
VCCEAGHKGREIGSGASKPCQTLARERKFKRILLDIDKFDELVVQRRLNLSVTWRNTFQKLVQ